MQWGQIQAVSLDMDGTLYDLDHFKVNLALRKPLDLRWWVAMEKARGQIRAQRLTHPDMHGLVVDQMAQRLGRPTAEVAARVQVMLEQDWPWLLRKVGAYRKLTLLLDALVQARIPMLLCSDYPGEAKAQALGLGDYPWVTILDATAHGALKPRREVFDAVVEALVGVAPGLGAEHILHVGDSWELDVQGALGVGMSAAWVGRHARGASPAQRAQVHCQGHMDRFCEQFAQALGGSGG